jgi:hypothetical protein
MVKKILCLLVILSFLTDNDAHSQDTLPNFTARNIGKNRIVISWTNTFDLVKQINIQRSADSLKGYKTILSVPDPMNLQNGFLDGKAPDEKQFYRLFIVLDKGMFTFSTPRRAVLDTEQAVVSSRPIDNPRIDKLPPPDSLVVREGDKELKVVSKPSVFVPSMRIYTYKDGNVRINLPDVQKNKYRVKFFENDDRFLFEIKDLKESPLLLDKSNFYHAGWFKFELYENNELVEKHKFYLAKDF